MSEVLNPTDFDKRRHVPPRRRFFTLTWRDMSHQGKASSRTNWVPLWWINVGVELEVVVLVVVRVVVVVVLLVVLLVVVVVVVVVG